MIIFPQKIKEANEEIVKEYGFCIMDGHKEKIGENRGNLFSLYGT